MKKFLFYISILFSVHMMAQDNNTALFNEANDLYNKGKYAEAIDKYRTILDHNMHSSELYFNLANANYKLNNIAPSIYYYEKALQLDPDDKDIKNNLAFARNMTIDAIDSIPEVGLSKVVHNTTNLYTTDTWAYISVVAVICFVILFLIYHFSYETLRKRTTFILSLVAIGVAVISLSSAFYRHTLEKNNHPAIVFAKESKVKSEPNVRSEESFRLHEGTKLQVTDTIGNWSEIKLSDGKTGWISNQDIRMLKR
ncbi:tetratricopeptide repeat protein [Gaetbulibacter aestuarii]|uniref:Tetratricopeptide repeat protein n=1 Tax=Gaetbulibacter aestuarii TaxID=1502358 RepID=A0ABW7MVC9_9FLAO